MKGLSRKYRSYKKRVNHMTIELQAENEEDAKLMINEFQKAIRKTNRLFDKKVSYEMNITLKQSGERSSCCGEI